MNDTTENKIEKFENQPTHWFHHPDIAENLISIPSNKILLTYKIHTNGTVKLDLGKDKKNTVAVKPLDNGYYKLIAGLNSYVRAKALNLPIDAFITQDSRKEFVEKYKIGK